MSTEQDANQPAAGEEFSPWDMLPRESAETKLIKQAASTVRDALPAIKGEKSDAPEPTEEVKEAVPEETPKAEAKEEPKPEDASKLLKSWATLTKRESKLVERERSLSQREAAAKQAEQAAAESKALLDELRADPVAFMAKHASGDWYQKATQRFYNNPEGKVPVEEKLAALEKRLSEEASAREKIINETIAKREQERQAQMQQEQAATQYVSEVKALIASDDRFELTRAHAQGVSEVIKLVQGYWEKTQTLLKPDQAAAMIEAEFEKELEQLTGTAKAKSKLGLNPVAKQDNPKAATKRSDQKTAEADGPGTLNDDFDAAALGKSAHLNERDHIRSIAQKARRMMQPR